MMTMIQRTGGGRGRMNNARLNLVTASALAFCAATTLGPTVVEAQYCYKGKCCTNEDCVQGWGIPQYCTASETTSNPTCLEPIDANPNRTGICIRDGTCQTACPGDCIESNTCDSNFCCNNAQCPNDQYCTKTDPSGCYCRGNTKYNHGTCQTVPSNAPAGHSCRDDSQCASGTCFNPYFSLPFFEGLYDVCACTADADCDSGYYCNQSGTYGYCTRCPYCIYGTDCTACANDSTKLFCGMDDGYVQGTLCTSGTFDPTTRPFPGTKTSSFATSTSKIGKETTTEKVSSSSSSDKATIALAPSEKGADAKVDVSAADAATSDSVIIAEHFETTFRLDATNLCSLGDTDAIEAAVMAQLQSNAIDTAERSVTYTSMTLTSGCGVTASESRRDLQTYTSFTFTSRGYCRYCTTTGLPGGDSINLAAVVAAATHEDVGDHAVLLGGVGAPSEDAIPSIARRRTAEDESSPSLSSRSATSSTVVTYHVVSVVNKTSAVIGPYQEPTTAAPSDGPSASAVPSQSPSQSPSVSAIPSLAPSDGPSASAVPSQSPSQSPSVSDAPTEAPTDAPMKAPTGAPTSEVTSTTSSAAADSSSCADSWWYDSGGPYYNCAWYGRYYSAWSCTYYGNCYLRCRWFGNSYRNDGLTANEACTVCGCGGSSGTTMNGARMPNEEDVRSFMKYNHEEDASATDVMIKKTNLRVSSHQQEYHHPSPDHCTSDEDCGHPDAVCNPCGWTDNVQVCLPVNIPDGEVCSCDAECVSGACRTELEVPICA